MSNDPADKPPSSPKPFDVFRSGGSTQLPGQRFAASDAHSSPRRSGPVEQRTIFDASGGPVQQDPVRKRTQLRDAPESSPADGQAAAGTASVTAEGESETIRLRTYRVNLAERIARVKAEQKDALDHLQQLEDDAGFPCDPNDSQ